jgi:hypothetical protein
VSLEMLSKQAKATLDEFKDKGLTDYFVDMSTKQNPYPVKDTGILLYINNVYSEKISPLPLIDIVSACRRIN